MTTARKIEMKLNTALAVLLTFTFMPVANAAYKCKDQDGKIIFSDLKCAPDATVVANKTSVLDASAARYEVEKDATRARQDQQREENQSLTTYGRSNARMHSRHAGRRR